MQGIPADVLAAHYGEGTTLATFILLCLYGVFFCSFNYYKSKRPLFLYNLVGMVEFAQLTSH
jgi:hypothetical protein